MNTCACLWLLDKTGLCNWDRLFSVRSALRSQKQYIKLRQSLEHRAWGMPYCERYCIGHGACLIVSDIASGMGHALLCAISHRAWGMPYCERYRIGHRACLIVSDIASDMGHALLWAISHRAWGMPYCKWYCIGHGACLIVSDIASDMGHALLWAISHRALDVTDIIISTITLQ